MRTLPIITLSFPPQMPSERYKVPLTTNQEYGWAPKQLVETNPMFTRIKQQCDVTTYADAYVSMVGRSPYATKVNVGDPKKGG